MQWHREEYIELMIFGRIDRQMFTELFEPLVGLEEEWCLQGAASGELDITAFDWDFVPVIGCGGNTVMRSGMTPYILEENNKYLIQRDAMGRVTKLCKGFATIPLPMDYPVKDMDNWLKMKPFYEFSEDRIDWDAVQRAKQTQHQGALVLAGIPGGFDTPRASLENPDCKNHWFEGY